MLTAGIGAPEKLALPARNSRGGVRGMRAAAVSMEEEGYNMLRLTIGMGDCGRGRGKRRRSERGCDVNVEEEEERGCGW